MNAADTSEQAQQTPVDSRRVIVAFGFACKALEELTDVERRRVLEALRILYEGGDSFLYRRRK